MLDLEIQGTDKLIGKLGDLDRKVRNKSIRRAVRAGSTPTRKAMKQKAPKATGGLKRSIKTKMKTYKDGTTVAVTGPDRKYLEVLSDGRRHRPAYISHILENGSRFVAAQPFIAPAGLETKAEVLQIVASKLKEDIR